MSDELETLRAEHIEQVDAECDQRVAAPSTGDNPLDAVPA